MLEPHQRMMQKSLLSWRQELKSSSLRKAMVGPKRIITVKSVGSPPNTCIKTNKRGRKIRTRRRTSNNKQPPSKRERSPSQRIMFAFDLVPEPRTKYSKLPQKDRHMRC